MHKLYHAIFAHKITVFKDQNQQTRISLKNKNIMNIYCKSKWLLLLPLRDHFRNARFTLASGTLISFSQQSLFLFFVSMSNILKRDCWQRYDVTNGMSISRAFLARRGYGTMWWHQNVESVVVLKSCCWTWLCCSSMISSRYSSLTSEPNHRTPETDSPNPWGSIEPRLRTTALGL